MHDIPRVKAFEIGRCGCPHVHLIMTLQDGSQVSCVIPPKEAYEIARKIYATAEACGLRNPDVPERRTK